MWRVVSEWEKKSRMTFFSPNRRVFCFCRVFQKRIREFFAEKKNILQKKSNFGNNFVWRQFEILFFKTEFREEVETILEWKPLVPNAIHLEPFYCEDCGTWKWILHYRM